MPGAAKLKERLRRNGRASGEQNKVCENQEAKQTTGFGEKKARPSSQLEGRD